MIWVMTGEPSGPNVFARLLMLVAFALSLVYCLGGCGNYATIPGQATATALVWANYGMTDDAPPPVSWVTQQDLTCAPDGTGRFVAFHPPKFYGSLQDSDDCKAGATWGLLRAVYECQVALPDGKLISEVSFAHELYHAALHHRNGDGDPDHTDPGFGVRYGHPMGIVDYTNQDLKGASL